MVDSGWEKVCWEIDLSEPPKVVSISKNVHFGDPVDVFCLPELWSLHLYGYEAELQVDERVFPVREGYVGLTPPGAHTTYRYAGRVSPHLYIHFRLGGKGNRRVMIPAMQDAVERHDELYESLAGVIALAGRNPERVSARVWDVLWQIYELPGGVERGEPGHPAVNQAVELIERSFGEELSVRDLASAVGVSYGYLGKLFDAEYGESVVGFIRRRRIEKGIHLLMNSTLPIKYIAASVGIPDLQHFNKAVRSFCGKSPRKVRLEGAELPPRG